MIFIKKIRNIRESYKLWIKEHNSHIDNVLHTIPEFNIAYEALKQKMKKTYWECDNLTYYPEGRSFDRPVEVKFNETYKLVAGVDNEGNEVFWFEPIRKK